MLLAQFLQMLQRQVDPRRHVGRPGIGLHLLKFGDQIRFVRIAPDPRLGDQPGLFTERDDDDIGLQINLVADELDQPVADLVEVVIRLHAAGDVQREHDIGDILGGIGSPTNREARSHGQGRKSDTANSVREAVHHRTPHSARTGDLEMPRQNNGVGVMILLAAGFTCNKVPASATQAGECGWKGVRSPSARC